MDSGIAALMGLDERQDAAIMQARKNLTTYVIFKAARIARDVGFGYEERDVAPQTYSEVRAAYLVSMKTRAPFPVWSGESDRTIYVNKEGNYAFRFWHDLIHATQALLFETHDEIIVGEQQTAAVAHHFGVDSLEAKLMHYDTVGQSKYVEVMGEFPKDQLQFVIDAIRSNSA